MAGSSASTIAVLRPQPGPQERALASPADIVIYGGAAGGGKTFALLMEPLRHLGNGGFGAVIFRREAVQITSEGGLWDTAISMYPSLGGAPRQSPRLGFKFPSGARVTFAHLNTDADVLSWQGAQIPLICFDELTHFSRHQFFYMLSRNRSTCGVRPYIRATTNPDADSWVAQLIAWWIDPDSGYPIPERSGVVRWFARVADVVQWGESPQELQRLHGVAPEDCKSLTFIAASVFDNQVLLKSDPGYLANLKAMALVERERLLGGNWKIRPAAGLYFKRTQVRILEAVPDDVVEWSRGWDFAGTEVTEQNTDPDWTAGVKIGLRADGRYVVVDAQHERFAAADVRRLVLRVAGQDGRNCRISVPEDPGQAGKEQATTYVAMLGGYPVYRRRADRNKIARAEPFASQWQAGNVDVVRGAWNEWYFGELEAFPDGGHDDGVDASSDAFATLPPPGSSTVGFARRSR